MAQKVMILGSTGMLGHQVLDFFLERGDYEVHDIVFRRKRRDESIICDVTNFGHLKDFILDISPDFIVNCIGILIKGSRTSQVNAITINALLPHFLVEVSDAIKCRLIHVSTDCVFSGKDGNYVESSFRDSDDLYGRSKALGEIVTDNHLTIRTSIVGPELKLNGEGLLHWFLTNSEKQINGFSNVLWGGVTTHELSRAIHFAISTELSGLWNLTNNQKIPKSELLRLFNSHVCASFKKSIVEDKSKTSDKSLRTERDIDYRVPSYDEMIGEMFERMKINQICYPHYIQAM